MRCAVRTVLYPWRPQRRACSLVVLHGHRLLRSCRLPGNPTPQGIAPLTITVSALRVRQAHYRYRYGTVRHTPEGSGKPRRVGVPGSLHKGDSNHVAANTELVHAPEFRQVH